MAAPAAAAAAAQLSQAFLELLQRTAGLTKEQKQQKQTPNSLFASLSLSSAPAPAQAPPSDFRTLCVPPATHIEEGLVLLSLRNNKSSQGGSQNEPRSDLLRILRSAGGVGWAKEHILAESRLFRGELGALAGGDVRLIDPSERLASQQTGESDLTQLYCSKSGAKVSILSEELYYAGSGSGAPIRVWQVDRPLAPPPGVSMRELTEAIDARHESDSGSHSGGRVGGSGGRSDALRVALASEGGLAPSRSFLDCQEALGRAVEDVSALEAARSAVDSAFNRSYTVVPGYERAAADKLRLVTQTVSQQILAASPVFQELLERFVFRFFRCCCAFLFCSSLKCLRSQTKHADEPPLFPQLFLSSHTESSLRRFRKSSNRGCLASAASPSSAPLPQRRPTTTQNCAPAPDCCATRCS
jgi:hypothetical protein